MTRALLLVFGILTGGMLVGAALALAILGVS